MEQSNYRRRTYTPEEDAIIIDCVEESTDNISRALRQASQSIGRTYKFATKQNPTPKPLSKWRRILNIIFE